ncbi:MAG TPA: hypothetical protein ENJ80_14180 [Gammaproteobacteria bacterium]|nr:hypothetical protein [Gammaproteobacteria bacterium]
MGGRIEFSFGFSSSRGTPAPRETDPMQILVLGNFSASSTRPEGTPLPERRIYPVDPDSLDQLPGQFTPTLDLQLENGLMVPVTFSAMDDFHPDSLYRRLPVFDELRDIVRRLSDNATFPEAAAQLRAIHRPPITANSTQESTRSTVAASGEDDSATFERLLGRSAATEESPPARHAHSAVEQLISEAIKDQIVPETAPEQRVYTTAAEDAISDLMRQILQHPEFRALEALWRGLDFLARRTELDENLKLFACDVSRDELLSDFQQAGDDLEQSGLFQRLVTQGSRTPGNSPWSLIVGAYTFDASPEDVAVLAALGTVAAQAGGPLLAAASPGILGCRSLPATPDPRDWKPAEQESDNWQALRQSPVAPWIGLALPRLLMRLPYGENTDELELFAFEEITEPGNTNQLLWGNPAFAVARLIARAFTERGWRMQPDDVQDIGELPAYSYQENGEWTLTPCSEVFLSETAIDRILQLGLIPLVSLKNTNSVRLPRFQSVSETSPALAGQW